LNQRKLYHSYLYALLVLAGLNVVAAVGVVVWMLRMALTT